MFEFAHGPLAILNRPALACVQKLAPWAARLSADELQRRRNRGLTPRQDALLVRWGYPYVGDEFRFHCSLTGGLSHATQAEVHALKQSAEAIFHGLPIDRCDAIALFEEPSRGANFRRVRQFKLQP